MLNIKNGCVHFFSKYEHMNFIRSDNEQVILDF